MKKGFSIFPVVMQLLIITTLLWLFGCSEEMPLDGADKVNIEGIVTTTNGLPAFGMQVNIVNGTGDFPKSAVETDRSGYYQITHVSQGTFEVAVADKAGNRIGLKNIIITNGEMYKLNFVIPLQNNEEFIIMDMPIRDISIQLLESYPLQVHVIVNGVLNDGCTTLNDITQQREGNTVRIHITTKRPKDASCTKAIRSITENVPLEGGFLPGKYKVIVNNLEKDFEIQGGEGNGILQGKVTIGPLCPVEPCNLPPEKIAEIYEARKVIIYQQATKTKIIAVNLDGNGKYYIPLEPGNYIVDISDAEGNELPLERDQRPFLGNAIPQEVEVKSGKITNADFDIDTGIR